MKNADEDEVLRLMPPPMRRSTIKFVYSDLVSKMLLFKGLNEAVTMEMLVALRMPRDSCWHLGCIIPRVPAMIVRTGPHYVQKGELVVEEVRPNRRPNDSQYIAVRTAVRTAGPRCQP